MRRVRKFVQIVNSDYLDKLINAHLFCKQIKLPQRQAIKRQAIEEATGK